MPQLLLSCSHSFVMAGDEGICLEGFPEASPLCRPASLQAVHLSNFAQLTIEKERAWYFRVSNAVLACSGWWVFQVDIQQNACLSSHRGFCRPSNDFHEALKSYTGTIVKDLS